MAGAKLEARADPDVVSTAMARTAPRSGTARMILTDNLTPISKNKTSKNKTSKNKTSKHGGPKIRGVALWQTASHSKSTDRRSLAYF